MRSVLALGAGCAVIVTGVAAQPMKAMDVFDIKWVTSPIVDRSGERIYYLRNSMDVMQDRRRANLWTVSADGSDHRPLTTGPRSVSSPALAPDGGRIAFVDKDDTGSQIFLRWTDGSAIAQLTRVPESPRNLSWSPNGKWIAFAMRVPVDAPQMGKMPKAPKGAEWAAAPVVVDRMVYRNDGAGVRPEAFYQLFVLPAEGGAPRQLTDGPYDHSGRIAWSPDATQLYFSANRGEDRALNVVNSDLFRLDIASGELTQLTERQGADHSVAVAPDGSRLAWICFDDRGLSHHRQGLYIMDANGENRRELAADLDRSIANPQWSEDSSEIYFQYDDRGKTLLARINPDGGVALLATDLGGTSIGRPYSGAAYAVGGGRYAFTRGSTSFPADLATGRDLDGTDQITALNANGLGERRLATVEEHWLRSSADGEAIQAWVALPPGFDRSKKYPLILEIHGGPHTNYGPRFSAEVQLYAAAGYVVLYVNPRGSTSYGEDFANLIHHNYPSQDYDDLMSAVDAVIDEGYVNPDQLYVTGGSGGGVLTAWIVGRTQRFRAAVVAKPVINWTSFALTADNAPFFTRYWFPAMPWEDPMHYWRRSPLSLVGKVETPTMLLSGEADLRTPISEAEQYYQALKLRGIPTAMVRIPGAYHSIAKRPSQLIAKVTAILAWFERHADEEPLIASSNPVEIVQ
ncbi:MAG: S9 family peptidase [Pseudomonadota bacterium]